MRFMYLLATSTVAGHCTIHRVLVLCLPRYNRVLLSLLRVDRISVMPIPGIVLTAFFMPSQYHTKMGYRPSWWWGVPVG